MTGVPDIPADEALRRIYEIVPRLASEVRGALESRAVMEAANDLTAGRTPNVSPGVATFNIIQRGLVRSLAVDVASAFDFDEKRSIAKEGKASIPILVILLRAPGVRDLILDNAASWTPFMSNVQVETCGQRLDEIGSKFTAFQGDLNQQEALRRLREIRNYRLAHSLFDKEPADPTYDQLFGLLDVARDIARDALLAVAGRDEDWAKHEQITRHSAVDLWTRALKDGWLPDQPNVPFAVPRHVSER